MIYKVLKPFVADGRKFHRGESVPSERTQRWKNKDVLLRTRYLSPKTDSNTFRVHRSFAADGKQWRVGELVKDPHWRNVGSLLGAGYLQPTSLSEGASPTAPSEQWKDRGWLQDQYVIQKKSPVAIAKEAGCSVGTLYHWLHKYGLKQEGRRRRIDTNQEV